MFKYYESVVIKRSYSIGLQKHPTGITPFRMTATPCQLIASCDNAGM